MASETESSVPIEEGAFESLSFVDRRHCAFVSGIRPCEEMVSVAAPMSPREERIVQNEALFREINEHIAELAERIRVDGDPLPLLALTDGLAANRSSPKEMPPRATWRGWSARGVGGARRRGGGLPTGLTFRQSRSVRGRVSECGAELRRGELL